MDGIPQDTQIPLDGDQPVQVFTVSYEDQRPARAGTRPESSIGEARERDPEHQRARDRGHRPTGGRLLALEYVLVLPDRIRARRLDGVIRRVLAIAAVVVTALLCAIHRLRTAPSAGRSTRSCSISVTIAWSLCSRARTRVRPSDSRAASRKTPPMNEPEGTDRAHAHAPRLLGGDVPAVHRVALAARADDRRGRRDGGGPGVLRGRVGRCLGTSMSRRHSGVRVALLAALYNAVLTPILYPSCDASPRDPDLGGWCGSRWTRCRPVIKVLALAGGVDVRRARRRLWFLQVLATTQFQREARDNSAPVRAHGTVAWPDVRRPGPPAGRESGEPRGPREP